MNKPYSVVPSSVFGFQGVVYNQLCIDYIALGSLKEVVIRTLDEPKDRKDAGISRSHGDSRELVQEVERYQRIRRLLCPIIREIRFCQLDCREQARTVKVRVVPRISE